jgi:hypothetical protein
MVKSREERKLVIRHNLRVQDLLDVRIISDVKKERRKQVIQSGKRRAVR